MNCLAPHHDVYVVEVHDPYIGVYVHFIMMLAVKKCVVLFVFRKDGL